MAYQPKTYSDFIAAAYAKYLGYLSYELPDSQGDQGMHGPPESLPRPPAPFEGPPESLPRPPEPSLGPPEQVAATVKVVEITTEPIPKRPKELAVPKAKEPARITIRFRFEFAGKVSVEGVKYDVFDIVYDNHDRYSSSLSASGIDGADNVSFEDQFLKGLGFKLDGFGWMLYEFNHIDGVPLTENNIEELISGGRIKEQIAITIFKYHIFNQFEISGLLSGLTLPSLKETVSGPNTPGWNKSTIGGGYMDDFRLSLSHPVDLNKLYEAADNSFTSISINDNLHILSFNYALYMGREATRWYSEEFLAENKGKVLNVEVHISDVNLMIDVLVAR